MDVDYILERLQSNGYRATKQRRAVVEKVLAYGRHFTSTEIERDIERDDEHVGRATIFRTLERLEALGILARINSGPGPGYIVCGTTDHHHHLVCSSCGLVVKVPDCHIEDEIEHLSDATGFRVDGHYLEYYGLCNRCQVDRPAK